MIRSPQLFMLAQYEPAPSDSDAGLVERYVWARDEDAFRALLLRHGPTVRAVCQARLRQAADVDDATQTVWMVFARDAHRVCAPERISAWLVGIAVRTCQKLQRTKQRAEQRLRSLPAQETASSRETVNTDETAILAEELAELPEKFRATLVLCALQDRTRTEAALILGCPAGTVDSRLSVAKKRLHTRLVKRGLTLGTVLTLDALLAKLAQSTSHARPSVLASFDSTVSQSLAYILGLAPPSVAVLLAQGVSVTMFTTTKLFTLGLVVTGLTTLAGVGYYQAVAQDTKPVAKAEAATKPDTPPQATPPASAKPEQPQKEVKTPQDSARLREVLNAPAKLPQGVNMSYAEFLASLQQNHDVVIRVDLPSYRRTFSHDEMGITFNEFVKTMYETKIEFFASSSTLAELLNDAFTQLPGDHAFRIAGNRIIITPSYIPPSIPNRVSDGEPLAIDPRRLQEQILGEAVSVSFEEVPMEKVLQELRKLTGANIVLDVRAAKEAAGVPITLTMDNVRLFSALEIIADMGNLKPVAMGNVYYITSQENAERLEKKFYESIFGAPVAPLPPAGGMIPVAPSGRLSEQTVPKSSN